jgi:hypothetical protein
MVFATHVPILHGLFAQTVTGGHVLFLGDTPPGHSQLHKTNESYKGGKLAQMRARQTRSRIVLLAYLKAPSPPPSGNSLGSVQSAVPKRASQVELAW